MSIISNLKAHWDVNKFPKPWNEKDPAIYAFLKEQTQTEQSYFSEEIILPDNEKAFRKAGFPFVPGAFDSVYTHHGGDTSNKKISEKIYSVFKKVIKNPTEKHISELYKLLLVHQGIEFVDGFIPLISENEDLNFAKVQQFAKWLAEKSPDREPVKVAVAILGIFPGDQNKELLKTIGCHEEFTLYSVISLVNTLQNPELELWELAKKMDGWGKIHIVEQLAQTKNQTIKRWMLREGYKNSITYEYLAYICAVTGQLLSALKSPEWDEGLLSGAGDLIESLIRGEGGPAEGMKDYEEGVEATQLYIRYVSNSDKVLTFKHFLIMKAIRDFVEDKEKDWEERKEKGWTEKIRKEIADKASAILSKPEWKKRAISVLESEVNTKEYHSFYAAVLVAEALDIDTWDYYYEKQRSGRGNEWYSLMRTKDISRIDKVIALAEKMIPLNQISTGPAREKGLGPKYAHHRSLDFIVQDLRHFPGKGWNLIKAGLSSPVVRNRTMSLMALSQWGQKSWPETAEKSLKEALENEPDSKIKKNIEKVIDGKPI